MPSRLLALSAEHLPVVRPDRYSGDEFSIFLKDLHPDDVSLVRAVYQSVREIYDVRLYMGATPELEIFHGLFQFCLPALHKVRLLGRASLDESRNFDQNVSRALHDVRAGALSALVGYLDLHAEESLAFDPETVERCVALARDHAKLMRNCIEDLDPWIRRADERISLHSVQADLTKWGNTVLYQAGKAVRVECEDRCQGYVSNRCLETSSIDRILYNLMNNAARFSNSSLIRLRVDSLDNRLSRWVVCNEIGSEHIEWLKSNTTSLDELFCGGTTRDGNGIGLSNCARLVQLSFGLPALTDVMERGYAGAQLEGNKFYAWFHWPLYQSKPSDPICDCS